MPGIMAVATASTHDVTLPHTAGRHVLATQLVAAEAMPLEVRQAASVNFKNHVKAHWQGRPADDLGSGAVAAMPDAEKVGQQK